MSGILDNLNREQKEAVLQTEGASLVLAGAGTGKTRVLTSKIAYLLENGLAYPSEILAVTFTNKASREMHERVVNFLMKDITSIWLGTFHSIGHKILQRHAEIVGLTTDYNIMDPDEQSRLLKQILLDFDIDIKDYPVKNYVNKINEWKDKGITADQVLNFSIDFNYLPDVKEIYKTYQERCKKLNVCDFGDLLLYNIEIFKQDKNILNSYINRFKYLLVDEYQDTNAVQHSWLKMISGCGVKNDINITCVGDDDQSIYGWRGAEIKNILSFEKDFKNTKITRLERNYRSTSNILNVASSIIEHNKDRHSKKLWTDEKNLGEKVFLNCFDRDREEVFAIASEILNLNENKSIQYKDMAILVRAGYQTRIFEEVLIGQQIPYRIVGGFKFYDRKEIKDLVSYLKLVKNNSDFLAFERVVNTPKRGVGSVTLGKILEEVKGKKVNILNVCEDLCIAGILKGKTADNILKFVCDVREWSRQLTEIDHITLAKNIIEQSGYLNDLMIEKTDESKSALENIKEFLRGLEEFQNLSEFLEYISLVNDKTNSTTDNSINLMTIHSAKGLEFDSVFLPGWEEGVFPSPRSVDEKNGVEEERRLAYVAITRAKNRLSISFSKTRYEFGEIKTMQPSRFVKELPDKYLLMNDHSKITNNYNDYNDKEYDFEDEEYSNKRVGRYNNYYQPKQYNQDKNNFIADVKNVAKRVIHPTFGEGVVIKREDRKLTIAFKTAGIKTIIEDFISYLDE